MACVASASSSNTSQIEALHQAGNIFNAVLRHDRKAVDALLRADPHVLSTRGPVGELPLHMAFLYASPAHHVLAFYLMSRCPHLITETYLGTEYHGENILHICIIQQHVRMVERLVRMEPSLLLARATGRFFSRGGHCYYGETPLNFAACTGQQEMVAFLISAGADLDSVDRFGNNALHLMVLHSRPDMYSYIKAAWSKQNDAKPIAERCVGNRVLWQRRNLDGFTPMTLSAAEGNALMFSFLLEEEKQMQWRYGPVSCYVYPLEQIDMPLAPTALQKVAHLRKKAAAAAASAALSPSSSPSPSPLGGAGDDDDDDEEDSSVPRALELIVNHAHLSLLMHPRMLELIRQKWERFAARIFFQRFLVVLLYLVLFTAAAIHRQSEHLA